MDADVPALGQIPEERPEAAALAVSTYCNQPSLDPREEQLTPFADAPFSYKTIQYEAKSAEPIRVQKLVCGLEDTPIWGTFLITDRRLVDPDTNQRVRTTKRTITMFGGQVDPPIEAYAKSTLPAGRRRMAVLQEPFGRLTSMEDDAPLIQPGHLWQYGNGTMIVARNVAELNLIVKRVTVFQKWSLSTKACATNTWLEDIECGHVLQYAEQGPILVDLGEVPRSIQRNHVTFREITIAPWFDISKESQDHLVACTLDYCAKMDTEDVIKVDRALAESLKEWQGVVVDQIPDPFDRLSRTDRESKTTYRLLQGIVAQFPNDLILIAESRHQMVVLIDIITHNYASLIAATTAGVEYIEKDAEPILLSSDEESEAPLEIGPMDLPKLREVVRLHKELMMKINGLPMQIAQGLQGPSLRFMLAIERAIAQWAPDLAEENDINLANDGHNDQSEESEG